MTRRRRTILQFLQIFLTEGLTFIGIYPLEPVRPYPSKLAFFRSPG
jgi:hypothetical protein